MANDLDVIIVGAGAAGVGLGVALRQIDLDVSNYVILERHAVGESFRRWPAEMRFISPSFNSNPFGLVDLNAITPNTSPAYTLRKEHPSGMDYARYLGAVADHFELPIKTGVDVTDVVLEDARFFVRTSQGEFTARFLVWCAGEFQYPKHNGFTGAQLCLHNSAVRSWHELKGKEYVVIGGYESGIDAAVQLSSLGKKVRVLDGRDAWKDDSSDPSISLSPYTSERLRRALPGERIQLIGDKRVTAVEKQGRGYSVRTDDDEWFTTSNPPILATGFEGSLKLIADLFEWRDDGQPHLNEVDESTITPGLFVAGPSVRQGKHIFCFIYKFRQRFAVVANAIGTRLGQNTKDLDAYRKAGMFLDDLSCCSDACAC
jgi:cation diffusion facilitator CzcD-associated flavoprotein CzcO